VSNPDSYIDLLPTLCRRQSCRSTASSSLVAKRRQEDFGIRARCKKKLAHLQSRQTQDPCSRSRSSCLRSHTRSLDPPIRWRRHMANDMGRGGQTARDNRAFQRYAGPNTCPTKDSRSRGRFGTKMGPLLPAQVLSNYGAPPTTKNPTMSFDPSFLFPTHSRPRRSRTLGYCFLPNKARERDNTKYASRLRVTKRGR